MSSGKQKQYNEFYKHRFPAKDFGYDDQKRLRKEFNTDHLFLLWNQKSKRCEVWWKDIDKCYIVSIICPPYNICRVIKEMKDRERSMKEVMYEYLKAEEDYKEGKRKYIRSMSEEIAKGMENWVNGRIIVGG